ncbi:MAG: molybdenum cofactor guanylyltransferase MobA [Rhodocyclaceae bacterium]|nr:molybdenum cofactor guanylyltransferase MobA [Rhodocyclaceae bacterium]MDZ4214521.1 molybdenum cofactor guanylyltransferase MobA [Rhodocyclaceae bacterium]
MADKAIQVTGLILAGGAGRRMGGADKGLLDYQGRPLVAHVLERLAPQVDSLLISANRNQDIYAGFGYPLVSDDQPDYPGPLAGLAAGLAACPTEWLVCVPCDCPALPLDLVSRLWATAQDLFAAITVASTGGRMQPTFQLCQRSLLPALLAYLASGERKVGGWCRAQAAVELDFADSAAFRNLNSPDELAAPQ